MWKWLRVLILLTILIGFLGEIWQEKSLKDWKKTIYVGIYPINAEKDAVTQRYIQTLSEQDFADIPQYMKQQLQRYHVPLDRPIQIVLAPQIETPPPALPEENTFLKNIMWSLKFRFYTWTKTPKTRVTPHIKLYLLYFDPKTHAVLTHSTALKQGLIGRINVYANAQQSQQNQFVIAHEMLHTLGATDKYDLQTNLPLFPQGYDAPDQNPLYPQKMAEIMGGRIPVSAQDARIPDSLAQTNIGMQTAQEIGLVD